MAKPQPLILIPGLLSNHRVWTHQVAHLKDIADIQLIEFTNERTIEQMLATILKNAPPQFAVAGHSMGGCLAIEILNIAPERVTKLCLLNTTARGDTPQKVERRKQMIAQTQQGKFKTIAKQIAEFFVYQPSVIKNVIKMFMEVGPETFICEEEAMMNLRSYLAFLPKITCPTMVIHGRQDNNFTLDYHEEIASLIPHATLAIVEDAGHMSTMEMPQAVTALMRYWLMYTPR
jgi:pimeloyl-ACP methyl ester carboxylesterase